jgi:hypothetical protein
MLITISISQIIIAILCVTSNPVLAKHNSFTSKALSQDLLELDFTGRSSEASKRERYSNTPKDNLSVYPKNHLK